MIKNDITQNKFIIVDNNSLNELNKLNEKSLKSAMLNDKFILKPNKHLVLDSLLSFINNRIFNIKFSKDEILQLNNNEFINSLKDNYGVQPFSAKFKLATIIDSIKYFSPYKFIKFIENYYSQDFIDFVECYNYELYNYFCSDKEAIRNYENMNYEEVIKSRIKEINLLHKEDSMELKYDFEILGTYFYSGEIMFLNELNNVHTNYMLSLCS